MEIDTGIFDDQRIDETKFWGGYVTGPLPFIPRLKADFYYLGMSRDNAEFSRGTADELRHSLGTRLFGEYGALVWNFEFVGQFGSFGDDGILAWRRRPYRRRLPKRLPSRALPGAESRAATTGSNLALSTRCFRAVHILTKPR